MRQRWSRTTINGSLPGGEEPAVDDIKRCIRKGTRELAFFPTFCGSAFKNKGIQIVLNAVVDYLPNPTEVEAQPEVDLEGNETAWTCDRRPRWSTARVGVQDHGRLWRPDTRIYSGKIQKGDNVLNTFTGKTERIGRIVEMHADSEKSWKLPKQDIVALLGMKNTQTGHNFVTQTTLQP